MTKSTEIQSFILLFAFPFCLLSESATLKVYTSLVDYETLFNDDGVEMLSYNLEDSGILSNKVKVSGSMRIEGVYTSFTGEVDSPFVSQDNNQNGIYDFFEPDQSYTMSLSGSISYYMQGYGNFSANLFGSINRLYNQHAFSMDETITIQSSTINGINAGETSSISETLTAIHALGTIQYNREAGTYDYSLGYHGTTGSSSGSGTYQVNQDKSLTFSALTFPSMNEPSMATSLPGLAQKSLSGSVTLPYVGNGKFHAITAIKDVPYYVVIEDANDGDGDSFPDLIRSETTQIERVELGGWNYHIWPWVFSQKDGDWLYYHQINSAWMVWRNKTQKWYIYDLNSGQWVSS